MDMKKPFECFSSVHEGHCLKVVAGEGGATTFEPSLTGLIDCDVAWKSCLSDLGVLEKGQTLQMLLLWI